MKLRYLFSGVTLLAAFGQATAQEYPSQPITMIVGAAAGGPTDILARIVADGLKTRLPQPVVVENRPGQGGQLSVMLLSRASADGYTLAVTSGGIAALPITSQDFKLDPVADFTDVALLAKATRFFIASADAPFNSTAELVDYAKQNPGDINFGDMGGTNTLDMSLFASKAGIELSSVPYAGSASQVQTALAAGEIDLALDTYSSARNFLEQGKTKAIAVGSATPHEKLPNVEPAGATVAGYESSSAWYAIIGPKDMPVEIVTRLNTEINAVLDLRENRATIESLGLEIASGTPDELEALMKKDTELWATASAAASGK